MAPNFFKKRKEADKTGPEKAQAEPAKAEAATADAIPAAAPADGDKPGATVLLDDEDEKFLERLVANDDDDDGPPPPLPPRPRTPDLTWDTDSDSVRLPADTAAAEASTTATASKKPNRFSRLFHRKPAATSTSLTVPATTTPAEAEAEWADLNRVLARLDITPEPETPSTPSKTRAAALTVSAEAKDLLQQFVVVLKDIMRGAPTAVDDLVSLLDGRNDAIKRGYEKLPGSMQKLVTQLPKKLTDMLGPEVLAAAAEAQGLKKSPDEGLGKFFMPKNLGELVMTPAIVKSMLKAIVNALKLRWPAFVGTSMLWSAALFLLLFVLWYFHKRGKEEREKQEKEEAEGQAEAEEVGDMSAVVVVEPPAESPRS